MSVSCGTKNLFWTIKNGSKEDILRVLQEEKEIDFNRIDKHGKTVLTMTFANEKLTEKDVIDVLECFLDRGADPDIENKVGKTALLEAAASFKKGVVDLLTRRQANINKICKKGDSITHYLVRGWMFQYDRAFPKKSDDELKIMEEESATFVEWLIAKGFDFVRKNIFGVTALSQSLEFGLQYISLVILEHTQQINDVGNDKKNLLHGFFNKDGFLQRRYHKMQAEKWHKFNSRYASKILKILVDAGVSALDFDRDHRTPLWMAVAREEALDIIDMLLDRSVWSNHQRSDDVVTTVLIELFKASEWWGGESRTNHFLKVVRILIAEGADVNAKDIKQNTALYYAFQGQNPRAADVLNQNGADFGILCDGGKNLFHVLADSYQSSDGSQQEALFDLLASKACCDVNATDSNARTPLHCALRTANLSIAYKLIQHGADVNAKDSDGSTGLHLAVGLRDGSRRDELVELLLKSGAEVNLKNHSGKRPLTCVTSFTSRRIVQLLLLWGAFVNDYQGGESIFCRVFWNKGFECAMEMLAYGLDINDSRICGFFESQLEHLSVQMTGFFSRHSIKHKVANLPCSDYYLHFLVAICPRSYCQICLREVAKLKSTFIDSKTSLYDYLHMNFQSRFIYIHSEKLKNLVDRPEQLEQQFAEYAVLILARYRTAVKWKSLLEPAKEAWLRITHVALPDICIENIFVHLRIEDLVVFIEDV